MTQYNRLRAVVIEILGGKCVACSNPDHRVLQVDHIYSDGAEERRQYANGVTFLKHVIETYLEGRYQLLCANCNWLKRATHFECVKFHVEVIDDLTALAYEYDEHPP